MPLHISGKMALQGRLPLAGLRIHLTTNADGTHTAAAMDGKASATAPTTEAALQQVRLQMRELAMVGPGKKPGEPFPEGKRPNT